MSNLADVRDPDCIISFRPLVLGLTAREVSGVAAVLRRVLYRWCTARGLLSWDTSVGVSVPVLGLPGVVFSPPDVLGYQQALRREAKLEDFVYDCDVAVTQAPGGDVTIRGAVTLIDGVTYPLEVGVSGAVAALKSIGGT